MGWADGEGELHRQWGHEVRPDVPDHDLAIARAYAVSPAFAELPVTDLVDRVEAALGTPVQTAVKREDEQAFARLNAEHLMFAEDAARRIAATLQDDARVQRFEVQVAHHESLHAHDAVASARG